MDPGSLSLPVESRSEDIIRDQFEALLKSSLPDWIVGPVDADIDLSSSGGVLSAEAWIPVGKSRFAAGVRGDVFSFRIPFRAAAHETLRLGGLPVAELWGTSSGKVILKGFGVSLLGRWRAVASRRIDLAVRPAYRSFPFRGGRR